MIHPRPIWKQPSVSLGYIGRFFDLMLTFPFHQIAAESNSWFVGVFFGTDSVMLYHGLYQFSMPIWEDKLIPRAPRFDILDMTDIEFDCGSSISG